MIGAPPSLSGASQSSSTTAGVAVPTTFTGWPGAAGVSGVIGSVDSDAGPVPTALYAFTRKMCATPSTRSVTVRVMY